MCDCPKKFYLLVKMFFNLSGAQAAIFSLLLVFCQLPHIFEPSSTFLSLVLKTQVPLLKYLAFYHITLNIPGHKLSFPLSLKFLELPISLYVHFFLYYLKNLGLANPFISFICTSNDQTKHLFLTVCYVGKRVPL